MADEKLEKMIEFITTNPTVRRAYYTNPLNLLRQMVGRSEARQTEVGVRVEEAIAEDPTLVSERNEHLKAQKPAMLITHNPKLRTEYFTNPDKVLARAIPRRGLLERISLAVPERVREQRAKLGGKAEAVISNDPRLISDREAALEKNVFLTEALQNPERTFSFIVWLSGLAFLIGAALLVGAFVAAVLGDDTTQKAVLGGLSGAGGAATTLGTVFAISRDAVRKANGDNAQIRLILTGFATEMAHYRGISIDDFKEAQELNKEIREAMNEAVRRIEEYAEPEEKRRQADIGGAHSHPVQT